MKKLVSSLLIFVLLLSLSPLCGLNLIIKSSALDASGICGETLSYTFSESTGLLTISGTGEMTNYAWNGSPFYNDSEIKTVVIEDSVTSIGMYAFKGCTNLISLTIGNNVTSIGDFAFSLCTGLTDVNIGNSVTTIGSCAFDGCKGLKNVTIGKNVTKIGSCAFSQCSGLTSVKIPNSVKTIEYAAFSGCSGLTSITIPDGVTGIGDYAFSACTGIKNIIIPNGVTSIGECAFGGTGLNSVTIPVSVTNIGKYAFFRCTDLNSVYYAGSEEDWNKITIEDPNDTLKTATIQYNVPIPKIVTSTLCGVKIDDISLNYKNTAKIVPDITADEGAKYSVGYKSSNEDVAKVDKDGNVTTYGKGTATITCTVTDEGGNVVTDTCNVTVKFSFGQWIIWILLLGFLWY